MGIEKVVRSLVQQEETERLQAILLLLSDNYVQSTIVHRLSVIVNDELKLVSGMH
jgi:hypothetical protein